MKKGLIFDLDGTMWDSTARITESWQEVIDRYDGIDRKLTVDDVKSCMGLPMDEIFRRLLPDVSSELMGEIQTECEQHENEYLSVHAGKLYPRLEETLQKLKQKGIHLYIVSNSQDGYVQAFLKSTSLAPLFEDYEMFGRTNMLKAENIKLVVKRNELDRAAYVGDIQGDCDSSKKAGIPFVYADYGFGSVENYDFRISDFSDLVNLADDILGAVRY